jgi:excisionase family DNA binding protein
MSDAPAEKRTDFLTARQLADQLQVSESTIHRLRRSGRIPAVHVTDRLVRYNLRDVRRALSKDRATPPTAEPPHVDEAQMGFDDLFAEFETT